jgi:hypothetical protein
MTLLRWRASPDDFTAWPEYAQSGSPVSASEGKERS